MQEHPVIHKKGPTSILRPFCSPFVIVHLVNVWSSSQVFESLLSICCDELLCPQCWSLMAVITPYSVASG